MRAIGVILLIPSFVGFAIAGLFFISTIIATANVMPRVLSEILFLLRGFRRAPNAGYLRWLQILYAKKRRFHRFGLAAIFIPRYKSVEAEVGPALKAFQIDAWFLATLVETIG